MKATVRAVPDTGEYALFIPNDGVATRLLIEKLASINTGKRFFYLADVPVFEHWSEGSLLGVGIFQLPAIVSVQASVYQEFADYINNNGNPVTDCPPPVEGDLVGEPETYIPPADNFRGNVNL